MKPFNISLTVFGGGKLQQILNKEDLIMAQITELAGIINGAVAQLDKAKAEITGKIDSLQARIAELEAALASTQIPADAQAALDNLKADAQALDDVVPDA